MRARASFECNLIFSTRKGQLRENTLGVLIAVIGLVVLFVGAGYVLYKYFQISAQQNEDQAKGLLNVLNGKISALGDGQQSSFLVKGPCEGTHPREACHWYLTGWGKQDDGRPQRCFFKSCVCVCNLRKSAVDLSDKDVALRDACQNGQTGFCAPFTVDRVKISSVQNQTQDLPFVVEGVLNRPREERPAIEKSFIPFASNLIELKAKRAGGELEITLI